jgi:hypothetical protein
MSYSYASHLDAHSSFAVPARSSSARLVLDDVLSVRCATRNMLVKIEIKMHNYKIIVHWLVVNTFYISN